MNKRKIIWSIMSIMILVIMIANINGAFAQTAKEDTKKVEIDNSMYIPASITVTKGTTVNWVNKDIVAHTVTSDTGIFNSGIINPGNSFGQTFNNVGIFKYHCNIHLFMHGVVKVIPSSSSSITVVSPNGGERWARGTTHAIKWSNMGSPGSNVKIELLKGGILNRLIVANTPNGGSYNWAIPSTQILGTDYKIRITSTSNSAYKDISNSDFTISNPYITVVSPNGGESWTRGTTRAIGWNKDGNVGSFVKIQLYKGGVLKSEISSSTPNDGSYSWTIPTTQTLGTDYKIKITSTSNSIYNDWSNNNFRIS